MSSKALLVGGLASLFSLATWVVAFALVPDGNFDTASSTALAVVAVGSIATIVAFFGLYYLFAGRSPLNAGMLGAAVVGIALTLIPNSDATYSVGAILWGVALLIAGYLLRGSHSIWLSWIGLVSGALFVVIGVIYLAGQTGLGDTLNLVSSVPLFVWTIWIGWVMVKKSREVAPATG